MEMTLNNVGQPHVHLNIVTMLYVHDSTRSVCEVSGCEKRRSLLPSRTKTKEI